MEGTKSDSYNDDTFNSSFAAEFYDGYSFKNLVDFLRRINPTALFRFSADRIQCLHHDPEGKNILAHVNIESKELYKYSLTTPRGRVLDIGMNLRDLQKFIKSIGKKDSLTIYKKSGEHSIYIRISNSNKGSQGNFSVIRPCKIEPLDILIPEYDMDESRPSLVIPASSVSSTFNVLNVLKSSTVRICVKDNNLNIDNLTDDRSSGRVDTFPMRVYGGQQVSYEISVRVSALKCLTKLNNLSPNGLLKFYLENKNEEPLPIKIMGKINSWGELTIYLSSTEV
ncbi:putative proliferating cell nuclear antigen [Cedratvirus kamchatka]|uniref:Proliferating cell nuclear antigen n=1 Tax=Cedratvirus kamchatka TaxID=2716914 RepID=A0A6G8MXB2_9VIRU|nr:putative proliferating cell nuclear antigen [Cedratvirus kamchatka]WIL04016.1 proliferating cell nuclear antigen domain-containing protein [Cedratvirus lena]WIL04628.1 proliferating cell nuclear antigen domain-containing protein [Cedratvirus duvanny]